MTQAKPQIRLYCPENFIINETLVLAKEQSHYLIHVMRCRLHDSVAVFNGRDGEWLAEISAIEKKSVALTLKHQIAPQRNSPDIWLAFAPIKNKSELVAEKAAELGVSKLLPVFTRHVVVKSVNHEKLQAHLVEAAEQCGRHDVPALEEYKDLPALLAGWPEDRTLLYGDESGGGMPVKGLLSQLPRGKYGLLIGPEGGFSVEEHRLLKNQPFVKAFSMGPRILRADTAAVAALSCLQAWLGDWFLSCGPRSGSTGSLAVEQDPALALRAPQDNERL